jgi:hypothetical protein
MGPIAVHFHADIFHPIATVKRNLRNVRYDSIAQNGMKINSEPPQNHSVPEIITVIMILPARLPQNQSFKELTKGRVLHQRKTSSLARLNHSCV